MKRKYIKGFLCRELSISGNGKEDYCFFKDEPVWNADWNKWFEDDPSSFLCSLLAVWDVEKFKEKYDCNFRLPRMGKKVECWVEVEDE